ncbi:nitrate reductase subunit alpha [Heyndrickxia oleronia]|uniref:nitrate reductase (quinone) n=1 Tax=Heyndrickxia oleronia TaxID=38875 RepID=A0A8E2I9E1_9BACI|nr:nitrate reductase subunit alpha [Heyndrickxia oleronia]MEC1376425.1 nitrate reductase subunit alpha [Heyndrickxia oleronia]OOP68742.1 nitrate reductase subunit alpha [Heyndrickxia oleronia]QQZ06936.1 nitrate reductase subunit alpha [Heyndrickxia oleronia]
MSRKRSPLTNRLRYFSPTEKLNDNHSEVREGNREWEDVYRRRWQYDKVIRSTHGVNCTGSCSWNIFVKDGIVTWEGQNLNYPTTGPDMPDFEPRGCPRGASFSWYIYSPLRVKYPYIRGVLLLMWREALQAHSNPLEAWKSIIEDKEKAKQYKEARGKGGFMRADWEEASMLVAASLLYTVLKYGPDRNIGFSPIPAMSMLSYAGGSRFMHLMGAPMLSFYDWYADLPPASPQIWGDQTDVPESSDWYNSSYIITWGSNIPLTRTPDAHFLAEARYRGAKVISLSPDYAESTKFADDWLSVKQGTDGAIAMAMGHVILNEFYVQNQVNYFSNYVKKYTDFPFLVTLKKQDEGFIADRFLNANDIGRSTKNGEWKPVLMNDRSQKIAVPNGTMGSRWENNRKWNLHLQDEDSNEVIDPRLSLLGIEEKCVKLFIPYFGEGDTNVLERVVPIQTIKHDGETIYYTTVYDLMLANYGIDRGIGGIVAKSYDEDVPFTPKWQEKITGVKSEQIIKIAREFAQNAIDTNGRSMIIVGAGINHWFHSDTIYRAVLNLVLLVGAEGVNGGGWAHYVGQEKLRPVEGWQTIAMARDWQGPPRLQNGTSFFYFATDQWRYEDIPVSTQVSPVYGKPRYEHNADYNVMAARLGWLPSYPTFNANSLELYKQAKNAGNHTESEIAQYIAKQLKHRKLQFSIEDPDNEVNFPRNLIVWRANLISSSGKGHEYFLKHLLGATNGLLNDDSDSIRPEEIHWRDQAPEGKLDLLINLDFRMAGTALYSDVVLPASTWYEKHDLSSTDMHPFVHPFNPAISSPWEAKSDWDIFNRLAMAVSKLAKDIDLEPINDIVATPLQHDTQQELAKPLGKIKDWSKDECEPIPGKTMPQIHVVERDFRLIHEKMKALGPNVKNQPMGTKGISWSVEDVYEKLKKVNGTIKDGIGDGCPDISNAFKASEAVLMLSSTTNGKLAVRAWESLEKQTDLHLRDLAEEREEECFNFEQITAQPKTVITSPAFSGSEKGGRRYSPFTTNIERLIPFRTITGRQSFYIDHEMMSEFGENLATFKPILQHQPFTDRRPSVKGKEITLNYLTPHNKWSVHSMYFDSQPMLTLFRGGPTVWMNKDDAEDAEIGDNDWIECFNRNGVVVARAVVSHRIPRGMAFMHHAQDRHINVPGTKLTQNRGGTHNSPTKIHVKPTHMIGGYAQLSYGFNYYGPTGNQRDLNVVIRKLEEVDWLED